VKRFTIRKVKQHSYSRQGWILKECGYMYAVYDREWKKNFNACGKSWCYDNQEPYKYIDNTRQKEIAQYWADWLNANKTDTFGVRITIPSKVFIQGLDHYIDVNKPQNA